jgi:acetyl-CoA carboxylase biotin carboxyl carrier protein
VTDPSGSDPLADALADAAGPPPDPAIPSLDPEAPSVDPEAPSVDPEAAPVDPADARLFGVIDRLAAILDHSDLLELEIHVGETGLTLRKPAALAPLGASPAAPTPSSSATGPGSGGAAPASTGTPVMADSLPPARPAVKAPLTGIWYGSPAPGSAPYVQIGSEVAVGTVVGLIEAMKLFNEIKSDLAGRVVKVNAESGKLVKAKQPLIEVEPL